MSQMLIMADDVICPEFVWACLGVFFFCKNTFWFPVLCYEHRCVGMRVACGSCPSMLAGTWGKFGFYFVNGVCVFLRILIFCDISVFLCDTG